MKLNDWLIKRLIFGVLAVLYLALAWKNPFKTNNLISNLEPYPDTLYYSVPSWSWVHGAGFKMDAFGIEIKSIVPPLYGLLLSPFFRLWGDVRSYYFANIIFGLASIWLYITLIGKVFTVSKVKQFLQFCLGLILVTNFYFYNLPTLLMAENILIPLTFATVIVALEKHSSRNLVWTIIIAVLLFLTKLSALPVIACLVFWNFFKIGKRAKLVFSCIFGVLGLIGAVVLRQDFAKYLNGIGDFNLTNMASTLPIYISEFIGKNGKYLWYNNQQIEPVLGYLSITGLAVGIIWKKYRLSTAVLLSIIASVVIFHSQMKYPEGRYLSTVIPLYLLLIGNLVEALPRRRWQLVSMVILLVGYLMMRVTVNGFYERKVTTLKRQTLNNRLENNEVPWNYMAIENFNAYFKDKKNGRFLGTLLPPFYISIFGNGNYAFLPISPNQEFAGGDKGYIEKTYEKDGSVVGLYARMIREGNDVYVTNYYLNNFQGRLGSDYKKLEDTYKFTQVSGGCMDLCKIYRLELKK